VTPARVRALLFRRDEGQLNAAEQAELEQWLARDPEAQRAFLEHHFLTADLGTELSTPAAVRARPAPRARWSPMRLLVGGALAAAAVVLIVIGGRRLLPGRPSAWSQATLATVSRHELGAARPVRAGETIRVADGDLAVVTAPGTRLELLGGTVVRLGAPLDPESGAPEHEDYVAVSAGDVVASIDRPRPMVLVTPFAWASASAAKVSVQVSARAARFGVGDGSVALTRSRPEAVVTRGQTALVNDERGLSITAATAGLEGRAPDPDPRHADTAVLRADEIGRSRSTPDVLARAAVGELALLRQMPAELVAQLRGEVPNAEGFVGGNREGFTCSGEQRHAIMAMVAGVTLRRRDLIEDGFRAIEAPLQFQASHGGFLDSKSCDLFWLGQASHALVLLRESEDGDTYSERAKALAPRLAQLASWLSQPATVRDIYAVCEKDQILYFNAAIGFGMSGLLLDDPRLQGLSREFVDAGLKQQRPDGSFTVVKGTDAGGQASIMWRLGMYLVRFPDARYVEPMRRGLTWELGRVTPRGEIDVTDSASRIWIRACRTQPLTACLQLSHDVFAWSLLYSGALLDARANTVAADVIRTRRMVTVPTPAR
jgi:ferric-dicitrate binding protein FerR (iron transport regulator)